MAFSKHLEDMFGEDYTVYKNNRTRYLFSEKDLNAAAW